jgi:hypothetical protein
VEFMLKNLGDLRLFRKSDNMFRLMSLLCSIKLLHNSNSFFSTSVSNTVVLLYFIVQKRVIDTSNNEEKPLWRYEILPEYSNNQATY